MRKCLFTICLIFFCISSFAQKENAKNHTVGYHNIIYAGIQVNTNGLGGCIRRGFHRTVRKKKIYEINFTTLKHPREVKMLSHDGSRSFVFAKKNSVFGLRYGLGQHNIISFKSFGEGVELKTILIFGLNTTFLKPIYYYMVYNDGGAASLEQFDENRHNAFNISKPGSFLKGFEEINVQPGIFGKLALNFEYSAEQKSIRSLEIGAVVDGFYKNVEILAFAQNYPIVVSLYLSFQFGKKWYR